jgi:amylosucrase
VSPEDVVPYFGLGEATNKECEMAYHNSLMVLLWSALAERSAKLATVSLQNIPHLPRRATWLTYVRCHDDIGWAITDYNAAAVGLQGFWHRAFLSDFYAGIFENSFARGAVFQFNPDNQDRRISGACASLAGLEVAVEKQDWAEVELAIGRILFLHSLTLAYGGLPLIYMGDELGLLNDYSFTDDEAHRVDNRWLHRPKMDWSFAAARHQPHTIPGLIFRRLRHLISVRQRLTALHADAATIPVWVGNDQVLAIVRESPRGRLLVMGNCTETTQHVTARRLGELGFGGILRDHIGDRLLHSQYDIALAPYETLWLETVD